MIRHLQSLQYRYSLLPFSSATMFLQHSSYYRTLSRETIRRNDSHTFPKLRIPTASDLVLTAPPSMQPYLRLMRMDKPIGTWLLYWPCTWSIALATPAGELPSLYYLTLFGAGAILMRSAGCVINDLWDKEFDRQVERTKTRPLACGALTQRQALLLLASLLSASFSILMQLNWFSVAVGSASMLLVVGYPLAKRYTYWPQFILGATLNWGVLIAWAEMLPRDQFYTVFPLYFSTIFYTVIYDTIYSHQDKTDDIMIGVKSTALRFGATTKVWLSGFGGATVAGLGLVGHLADQTWPYYLALAGISAHLVWQVGTVNINDNNDCWKKFKSNQWIGAILFAGIVVGTFLKGRKNEEQDTQFDEIDEY